MSFLPRQLTTETIRIEWYSVIMQAQKGLQSEKFQVRTTHLLETAFIFLYKGSTHERR